MTSKHTPGPWDIKGPSKPTLDAPEGGDYAVMDGGTNIIAEVFFRTDANNTHNARANARLIAAAPDLLAALRAEQEWRDRERDGAIDPEWDYEVMVGELRRDAIAKATGEAA